MASTGIRIDGLDELVEQLDAVLPREAHGLARAAAASTGSRVSRAIKARAPVREGGLKKSIAVKRRRGSKTSVATDVIARRPEGSHWHLIEYGTKGYAPRGIPPMPAQPFVQPAVDEIARQIPEIFREEFGKKLGKLLERKAKRA